MRYAILESSFQAMTLCASRQLRRRAAALMCAMLLLLATVSCGGSSGSSSSSGGSGSGDSSYNWSGTWTLTWSDEFNGTNGSSPDSTKWVFDTGAGSSGWGNNELETYTNRTDNAVIQDGNLVITAKQETYTGTDGVTRNYTSARMKTLGLFSQKYGKFEARIKIPTGQGIWPAFWLLGANINSVSWPACGELDIMENIGSVPKTVYGTLHGPQGSGSYSIGGSSTLSSNFSDDFHIYGVEWEPNVVRFYVDGTLYKTVNSTDLGSNQTWAFDHNFFILLNLAVGGNWPGSPDATTSFPQTMLVDYVRVYSRQ